MGKMFKTYGGFLILAASLIFAVVRVAINQANYEDPNVRTIKICHWQLESGFRGAVQRLIDEYEAYYLETHGEKIRVIQVPISERGYQQYINTSLIGQTAPDIIEKGMATTANNPSYVARFFVPLSGYLEEPNPYNEGTVLEGLPWRETYVDGLQSAFDRELLDYYFTPFSMFTMRIYYNKDLYREVTGQDEPPKSWKRFQETAKKVNGYAAEKNLPLVTVAGSKVTSGYFRSNYGPTFLFDLSEKTDQNFDGVTSRIEAFDAYQKKEWSFDSDRFRSMWSFMTELSSSFQKGWTAAQRDDAVFMFVQGRSMMYVSGSWDAGSVIDQIGDKFEVGMFDFPVPEKGSEFGKFIKGLASEAATGGGVPWSITKQSKHPDLCIDFLRFCSTKERNERFNREINWLPVVRGTEMSERLKAFTPRIKGHVGTFQYDISTEFRLIGDGQLYSLYAQTVGMDDYIHDLTDIYERTGIAGLEVDLEDQRRNNRNLDRILGALFVNTTFNGDADKKKLEKNILQVTESSQHFYHTFVTGKATVDSYKGGQN